MVAVAIIGILAAIGSTQYAKFASKARQSEARLQLASIFTAQASFQLANGSYTACLRQAGFAPVEGMTRYYGFEFNNIGNTCGPDGAQPCDRWVFQEGSTLPQTCNVGPYPVPLGSPLATSDTAYAANSQAFLGALVVPPIVAAASSIARDAFTLVSSGNVTRSSGELDVWSMDHLKRMAHLKSGI